MKILLAGADGFIGAALRRRLLADGHELVCTTRRETAAREDDPGRGRWIRLDLATATAADWRAALAGVDAAVNAVGIFREAPGAGFHAVHTAGPIALFDACAAAGVRRVVQVSALGGGGEADGDADPPFLRSKYAADRHLLALPIEATVVRPSLVFGAGGASARRFLALAALPLLPLPAGGAQRLQPVHLDDVVDAIASLLTAPPPVPGRPRTGRVVALVGPRPTTWRDYLQSLRSAMGLRPARTLAIPPWCMRIAARVGDRLPGAMFDSAAWRMLQSGSSADAGDVTALLGRPPRPVRHFVDPAFAPALRARAELDDALPLLRWAVAAVWLWTGAVSLGLHPTADSYELLARAGVPAPMRPAALYGAAVLDLLLGIGALLHWRKRHRVWLAQALLMAAYMAIISVRLPEQWLHPYGPISKNLPMLAALLLLWMADRPGAGHRT